MVETRLDDEVKPEVAIVIFNDHGSAFDLGRAPTFASGIGDAYDKADEGHGMRPPVRDDADLGWPTGRHLINAGVGMTVCQDMWADHSLLVALLFEHDFAWSASVVLIVVKFVQHPLPSVDQCWRLSLAIGATIDAYPNDTRVAIVGTGSMSQQLHGKRLAYLSRDFDARWHDLVVCDLAPLAAMSHFDIRRAAGAEAVDLMTWLATRGAMTPSVVRRPVHHYGPSLTGMGLISTVDTVHVLVVEPH